MQPGNPYLNMINPNVSPERFQEMMTKLGYYDPIYIKYLKWLGRVLQGDFGYSINYGISVVEVVTPRLINTLILSLFSFSLSIIIAITTGVISAVKKNTIVDNVLTVISLIGISIPAFFFGMILLKIFAIDLKVLPVSGMYSLNESYVGIEKFIDLIKHIILPGLVLALLQTSSLMRFTRSAMIEELKKEYIKTARGKGLSVKKTIWKHGFRNALLPIITILCMEIPSLFSGALLTETIFVWPGVGRLNYEALLNRDYPLIMGLLMFLSLIIIISNIVADILYAIIDPRIKY